MQGRQPVVRGLLTQPLIFGEVSDRELAEALGRPQRVLETGVAAQ
jgi:hypothetical protein